MKLGFHISIAGGFKKVVARASSLQCNTIQLFSRNPRGWKFNPLVEEEISVFKKEAKEYQISPVFVHMPYLPNLGSGNGELYESSVKTLIEDLERTQFIGAQYLIMHVGSAEDVDKGIARVIGGVNAAFDKVKNRVVLLLENTAGAGKEVGYKFEQIARIIAGVKDTVRIGACLDTAHSYEAGYDWRTKKTVDETVRAFDDAIGLERLYLIHFNDSKTTLGSHSDRHWHIGQGEIGSGMGLILNHPLLKNKPFIMETPRKNEEEDRVNMKVARSLIRKSLD